LLAPTARERKSRPTISGRNLFPCFHHNKAKQTLFSVHPEVKVISPLYVDLIELAWATTSVSFSPASTEVNYSFYYQKDDSDAGIIVTVLVLIKVTILRTNRNPLKGPAGITTLPVCPRDLRSATVTSNYSRAVTILPTSTSIHNRTEASTF
jgi:hypothetical protein